MLLIILITTQVIADWVEISQQYYRKPLRTYNIYNSFTTQDEIDVEETTKSWHFVYNNKTVPENNWNKSPLSLSHVGNIKRAQNNLKHTEAIGYEANNQELDSDGFKLKHYHEKIKPVTELSVNIKQKGIVERVPNLGNVKRVQLNSSPVKSPAVNFEDDLQLLPKTRYEELPIDNEQKLVQLFKEKKNTESKLNNRRIYINKIVNNYTTETTFPTEDESQYTKEVLVVKKYPILELKNQTKLKHIFSSNPTFVTETEDFIQYDKQEDRFHKTTQSNKFANNSTVSMKNHILATESTAITETVTKRNDQIRNSVKQTVMNYKSKNKEDKIEDKINQPVTKVSQIDLKDRKGIINYEKDKIEKDYKVTLEQNPKPKDENNNNNQYINQDKERLDKSPKENKTGNKVNSVESLLKLMKVVADTISQNTQRSFGGKLRYLHELKDSILANIAGRIDASWPDDDVTLLHRSSRSAHASPRGHHVAFPSSESALMTISFLTFAVFLIKLVLQVIHTYKNKAMMVAPVMVAAAGRTTSAHQGIH